MNGKLSSALLMLWHTILAGLVVAAIIGTVRLSQEVAAVAVLVEQLDKRADKQDARDDRQDDRLWDLERGRRQLNYESP